MATIRTNTPCKQETQTTALPANAANATLILGASNNVAIQVDGADLTLEKRQF